MADSEVESDEDTNASFSDILSSVRLERLPRYCADVRYQSTDPIANTEMERIKIEPPLFGSYHVLYPITFPDNVRWLIKFPACGTVTHFDHSASSALNSEALTMRLIREKTSIPVPEVHAFNASLDNELGSPFILMDFIEGKSLYDCWFDKTTPHEILRLRRSQTLKDLAQAMAELNQFSFESGGSPRFDDGNLVGSGSMRCIDHKGMLDRLASADADVTALYFDAGPFKDPKSFYFHAIDREGQPEQSLFVGFQRLLRLFLDWIPELPGHEHEFVLTHPDLDIQNVIVSEDGQIRGIIDWDGVAALPRTAGNESYPSWLTRDWDPAMYGWTEEMESGAEPEGVWEDSPQTLARHREEYASFLKLYIPRRRADHSHQPHAPSLTSVSLFVQNLLIAAESPRSRFEILRLFVDRILELIRQNPGMKGPPGHSDGHTDIEKLDVFDISDSLVSGDFHPSMELILRKGFEALLSSDGCSLQPHSK